MSETDRSDQGRPQVAAIVVAAVATMVARWDLGLPRLVFSPEPAPIHAGSRRSSRSTAMLGALLLVILVPAISVGLPSLISP